MVHAHCLSCPSAIGQRLSDLRLTFCWAKDACGCSSFFDNAISCVALLEASLTQGKLRGLFRSEPLGGHGAHPGTSFEQDVVLCFLASACSPYPCSGQPCMGEVSVLDRW